MARYIDADAQIDRLKFKRDTDTSRRKYCGLECAISQIQKQPTADVAEIIHAKWEISSDGYYPYCSHCKSEPKNGVRSKYCPNCGAKMDGKDDA